MIDVCGPAKATTAVTSAVVIAPVARSGCRLPFVVRHRGPARPARLLCACPGKRVRRPAPAWDTPSAGSQSHDWYRDPGDRGSPALPPGGGFLAASMIYLRDNMLPRERREHLKPRFLGHSGTFPGITNLYSGLNGLVRRTGQRTLQVIGPGHGASAIQMNLWPEGTHAEGDDALSQDESGLAELVRRLSWPGGFSSHSRPRCLESSTTGRAGLRTRHGFRRRAGQS
jgi:XFP N-terminal domain